MRKLDAHLDGEGGNDALCVDQGWVAQVVQAIVVKDLCAGLEPDWLLELDTSIGLKQLRGQVAQGSEHGLRKCKGVSLHGTLLLSSISHKPVLSAPHDVTVATVLRKQTETLLTQRAWMTSIVR